jgi:boron transporter
MKGAGSQVDISITPPLSPAPAHYDPHHIHSEPSQIQSIPKPRDWWRIRFFHGIFNDLKRRAPFYWSDWKDAWNYRVMPASVYMYFAKYVFSLLSPPPIFSIFISLVANIACVDLYVYRRKLTIHSILPALAFSLEMFDRTHESYGVNEVLLAAVLGSVMFSFFSAQPLVILAVTGKSSNLFQEVVLFLCYYYSLCSLY